MRDATETLGLCVLYRTTEIAVAPASSLLRNSQCGLMGRVPGARGAPRVSGGEREDT